MEYWDVYHDVPGVHRFLRFNWIRYRSYTFFLYLQCMTSGSCSNFDWPCDRLYTSPCIPVHERAVATNASIGLAIVHVHLHVPQLHASP